MNDEPNQHELAHTEALLRQLTPAPVSLDRERLMFLAGQAAAESRLSPREGTDVRGAKVDNRADYRRYLWPTVAACLAIALVVQLTRPPRERIVVREVIVPAAAPVLAEAPRPSPPPQNPAALQPGEARIENTAAQVALAAPTDASPDFSPSVSLALPTTSVLKMRNVALRFGVDALPSPPSSTPAYFSTPSPRGQWPEP